MKVKVNLSTEEGIVEVNFFIDTNEPYVESERKFQKALKMVKIDYEKPIHKGDS